MLTGDAGAARCRAPRVRRRSPAKVKANDSATVVLIGHGTYDGEEYRFNCPAPDITGSELAQLFDELPAKQQLIMNATSASGATIELWQRPERVVITATKSGGERTATRFAQYWAQAVDERARGHEQGRGRDCRRSVRLCESPGRRGVQSRTSRWRPSTRAWRATTPRRSLSRASGGSANVRHESGSRRDARAARADRAGPERRQGAQGCAEPRTSTTTSSKACWCKLALLQRQIDAKQGGAMMRRLAHAARVRCSPLLAAGSAVAQSIDYDPRRASELRACDDHRYHGRVEQARACYSQLSTRRTRSSQAEAAWALGDLQRANECFRDIVQGQCARRAAARPLGAIVPADASVQRCRRAVSRRAEDLPERRAREDRPGARAGRALRRRSAGRCSKKCCSEDDELVEAHLLQRAARRSKPARSTRRRRRWSAPAISPRSRSCRRSRCSRCAPRWKARAIAIRRSGSSARSTTTRATAPCTSSWRISKSCAAAIAKRRRCCVARSKCSRTCGPRTPSWARICCASVRSRKRAQQLTAAYSGDPYSPTTVNSLRLLDRIDEFDVSSTPVAVAGDTYVSAPATASQRVVGAASRTRSIWCSEASRRSRSATVSSCRSR